MSSIYPNSLDGYAQLPLVVDTVTEVKADTVNRLRSAIVNIEKELGIEPKGTYADVRARLDALENAIDSIGDGGGGDIDLTDILNRISNLETKVNQLSAVEVVNQNTLLDESYGTVLVDASAGPITISLPSVTEFQIVYHIKKIDSSSNIVTIQPQVGETLDGESQFEINFQFDSYSIVNHTTGWFNI